MRLVADKPAQGGSGTTASGGRSITAFSSGRGSRRGLEGSKKVRRLSFHNLAKRSRRHPLNDLEPPVEGRYAAECGPEGDLLGRKRGRSEGLDGIGNLVLPQVVEQGHAEDSWRDAAQVGHGHADK